jgi:hypothetical protein
LNIKRLAYELRPATTGRVEAGTVSSIPLAAAALPKAPARPVAAGISLDTLSSRIDQFLTSRGYKAPAESALEAGDGGSRATRDAEAAGAPADFICEDDVREALKAGRKLTVGEKTIITPSARDLGESQRVFVQAGWPR